MALLSGLLVPTVLVVDLELEDKYGCFRIMIGSIAKRTCESSGYGGLVTLAMELSA